MIYTISWHNPNSADHSFSDPWASTMNFDLGMELIDMIVMRNCGTQYFSVSIKKLDMQKRYEKEERKINIGLRNISLN